MKNVIPLNKQAQQYMTAMDLAQHKKLLQVFADVYESHLNGVCMTAEAYSTFLKLCTPLDRQTHVAVELDAHMAALQFDSVLMSSDVEDTYNQLKKSN